MSGRGKTAIILTGGGMRSAHAAGFLHTLATKLNITQPDIIIGSSGSAGNVLYYVAGQYESIERLWTQYVSTPKFISYKRFWRIMDIDYLVDEILKHQVPLDVHAVKNSLIQWFIPVTNVNGLLRYIHNTDHVDLFEVLRAAKAIPILFRKKIKLFKDFFLDGEVGPTLEDHILCATRHGATRILVVEDGRPAHGLGKIAMELYALASPGELRRAIFRDLHAHATCVSSDTTTLLCIRPKELPVGLATRDAEKLKKTFEIGRADALAMEEELRNLFA